MDAPFPSPLLWTHPSCSKEVLQPCHHIRSTHIRRTDYTFPGSCQTCLQSSLRQDDTCEENLHWRSLMRGNTEIIHFHWFISISAFLSGNTKQCPWPWEARLSACSMPRRSRSCATVSLHPVHTYQPVHAILFPDHAKLVSSPLSGKMTPCGETLNRRSRVRGNTKILDFPWFYKHFSVTFR